MKPRSHTATPEMPPEVRPGQSVALLQHLHILTREGRLNQDSRRKLKQVHHLVQFIEKLLRELPDTPEGPTLADHGAGKSYLGFILYDLCFKPLGKGTIWGVETRAELVESSKALAQRLGFERMRFINQSVAEATHSTDLPERIDIVQVNGDPNPSRPDLQHYGAGETVLKPMMAAVANAIFDATGVRMRRVPLTPSRVLAALKA